MEKQCLDCEKPVRGRIDKKFCDDQCRSNYNNRLKSKNPDIVNFINSILKNNRKILEKLNPDGKTKLLKSKLLQAGFNFGFHTHIYETQKGLMYIFCYEYGYLALEKDWYLLVKRNEI
ncbi:hypothetical protein [Daejeonella oryzae]|uniref:hypothetical protein n=1 Tax=Daejeonella oryzae TaxID=1122943 RepID=UPI00047C7589|nr:hypothetical protein [Daejeonella oryzae]